MVKKRFKDYFEGKRVAILGFGLEGKSTYRLLRSYFPELKIIICDQNTGIRESADYLQDDKYASLSLGDNYLNGLKESDLIMKSPGIPYRELADVDPDKIHSQTSIFLELFRDQTIGITGTKGKSTTAALLYHILRKANMPSLLAGNIGTPCFDLIDDIDKDTIIVFEMSSHQLEHIAISPRIAVLLNIFMEHLDHYDSYDAYQQAKMNIARWQKSGDYFFFYQENDIVRKLLEAIRLNASTVALTKTESDANAVFLDGPDVVVQLSSGRIQIPDVITRRLLGGAHNLINIMAAAGVAGLLSVSAADISDAISTFSGLPHRLEYIGTFQGVQFINDSIATVPEATVEAVKAYPDTATLILGGMDRGLDYQALMQYLSGSAVRCLFFTGPAGQMMYGITDASSDFDEKLCVMASSFEEAVQLAVANTPSGKSVLLSPAATSYDQFRDFKERGERFKALVTKYAG